MQYLGGKSKISKQIISVMSAEREEGMPWVEPFMGSGKVISKVHGRRIGADVNHEMIALLKAIQDGWQPPTGVSQEFYYKVKDNQDEYQDHLKAFINIGCSFGAKRWGGYAQAQDRANKDYSAIASRSLIKMKPFLDGVELHSCCYQDLVIPERSLIYCDPPYQGTTGYGYSFNHEDFYLWCKNRVAEGHLLYLSEYNAPDYFEEIWSQETYTRLNWSDKKKERLFRLHKKTPFSLRMY